MLWALVVFSATLVICLWGISLTLFPRHNPAAILHYSVTIGIDLIGHGVKVMIMPLVGTILLVFNYGLGTVLYRAEPRIAWVVWSVTPFVEIILLISLLLLLRLNVHEPSTL